MVDLATAADFVRANGTDVERARLAHILENTPLPPAIQTAVTTSHNGDGGWREVPGYGGETRLDCTISTVTYSLAAMRLLLAHGLEASRATRMTAFFLFHSQSSDGSWREPELLSAFEPPPWMAPDRPANAVWLTAGAISYLRRTRWRDHRQVKLGQRWLSERWVQGRGFPGYVHATIFGLAAFAGSDLDIVQGCVANLMDRFNEIDPYELARLLENAHTSSLTTDHTLVARTWERLATTQDPDGSWALPKGWEKHLVDLPLWVLWSHRRLGHPEA